MDKQSLVITAFLSLSCCLYAESNRFSSSLSNKNLQGDSLGSISGFYYIRNNNFSIVYD